MFFSQKRKAALAVAFVCAVTAVLGEAMKTVADKVTDPSGKDNRK